MRHFAIVTCALIVTLGCAQKETPPAVAVQPEPPPIQLPATPQVAEDGIPPPREVPVRSAEEAFRAGVAFLVKQQSPDGAWRSDVYATFKDGTALTPLVLCALLEAADRGEWTNASKLARYRAAVWLAKFAKADGTIEPPPDGFDYPVYTAAMAIKALSHPSNAERRPARDAWVKYLKERQLTEKLGWKPEDKQYGGWGYCRVIPQKPEPGKLAPNLIESNLSATVFVLDALKAAGETDVELYKAAMTFVQRCQNTDGGFHFIYDDPTRNKAGVASADPLVFHSYGSTTADGLQALALCNNPTDKDQRDAARKWLLANFNADKHPGTYIKTHEPNRDAVYYYYAASVSRAFRDHKLELPNGRDWAAELSYALAARQAKDGSWTNPIELVRENDPIVATSNAVLALARCRK